MPLSPAQHSIAACPLSLPAIFARAVDVCAEACRLLSASAAGISGHHVKLKYLTGTPPSGKYGGLFFVPGVPSTTRVNKKHLGQLIVAPVLLSCFDLCCCLCSNSLLCILQSPLRVESILSSVRLPSVPWLCCPVKHIGYIPWLRVPPRLCLGFPFCAFALFALLPHVQEPTACPVDFPAVGFTLCLCLWALPLWDAIVFSPHGFAPSFSISFDMAFIKLVSSRSRRCHSFTSNFLNSGSLNVLEMVSSNVRRAKLR